MRRGTAVLVFLAFVAGPASNLKCLFACSSTQPAETSTGCHPSTTTEALLGGAQHCADTRGPAPLFVKRSDAPAPVLVSLPVRSQSPPLGLSSDASRLDAPKTGLPLSKLVVPLRI